MRKAAAILISVILTALLAAQFAGCEKYVLPELTISSDTLWFSAAADSQLIVVHTNVITTLYPEAKDGWLSANPEWLNESHDVYIRVRENPDPKQRVATIPVKSEAIHRNLVVIQEAAPETPTS